MALSHPKQKEDDRTNASKMSWPGLTTQRRCECLWYDVRIETLGVNCRRCGKKDGIHAFLCQLIEVTLGVTWVGRKVLIGPKLGWIDEYGNDDPVSALSGRSYE